MDPKDSLNQLPEQEKRIRRNLYRALRKTGVKKTLISLDADFDRDLHFNFTDRKIFTYFLERIFNRNLEEDQIQHVGSVRDTLCLLIKAK